MSGCRAEGVLNSSLFIPSLSPSDNDLTLSPNSHIRIKHYLLRFHLIVNFVAACVLFYYD